MLIKEDAIYKLKAKTFMLTWPELKKVLILVKFEKHLEEMTRFYPDIPLG